MRVETHRQILRFFEICLRCSDSVSLTFGSCVASASQTVAGAFGDVRAWPFAGAKRGRASVEVHSVRDFTPGEFSQPHFEQHRS